MFKLRHWLIISGIAALTFSCGNEGTKSGDTENKVDVAVKEEPKVETKEAVCIWNGAVGIRETTDSKSKYITSISLGERMTFTGETETTNDGNKDRDYAKVKLMDGKEGWLRSDFIVIDGKLGAIVKETATIYKRPDILTKSDKSFAMMDIIAVTEEKGDWLSVKGVIRGGSWFSEGWIKKSNITTGSEDIAVAVFANKASKLKNSDKQKAELQSVIDNSDLSGSVFIPYIKDEVQKLDDAVADETSE